MVIKQWRAADDWKLRSFRLGAERDPKGELLFLGGRGDFFEKYIEAFGVWRQSGWNVSGFDWRGQGGSGRLHKQNYCHIDDFTTFIGDLEEFAAEWRSRGKGPHVAIGHSMGGHILLRAALTNRLLVDGLVLLSPMLGIKAGPLRGKGFLPLAAIGRTPAFRERPIWRGTRSPAAGRITSCPERHADKLWWKAAEPELGRGGPTWGWLAAAMRSMGELERCLCEQSLAVPGLMLAALDDPVVDRIAIDQSARLLPSFDYRVIRQSGHELLRERDGPRCETLTHVDAFLDAIAGAK